MDWLEEEIKRAVARQDPPPGFAERLRHRSADGPAVGASARRWLAIAASVLLVAAAGIGYRRHQGVEAKKQVMLAVRLTAGKLNRVQSRVREVGQ